MENQNSVCYVGCISEIIPITGADSIEIALVGGWQAITKKGEHIVGDKVIVATTDAVIPTALSDAMQITSYLRKGQRVRTVKLRGTYSECLLIPFTQLPPGTLKGDVIEGDDMMEILGVYKFDPPVAQLQLSRGKKIRYRANTNFHIYYKFPNVKNVPEMFCETDFVQITRKLHGTNARYGIVKKTNITLFDKARMLMHRYIPVLASPSWEWLDYEYAYGSHNVEKGSDSQGFYSTDVWRTIADTYDIQYKLWNYVKQFNKDEIGAGLVLYGEIYGDGIQKNYDYGLGHLELALFDITVDNDYQLCVATEWIAKELQLTHVPILYDGKWSQNIQDQYTFKNYIEGTKVPHEGIVIKEHSGNRRQIAKVINPDYLIYSEKNNVGDSH